MADATAATTPKIEELRARLKADPKSRHFYPLAEELRKIQQLEQAEEILREGLQTHSSYLSAWISLGRVLRDRGRDHEAVEVLKRALGLDGGNVVAAKLLAQAYLGVGDKIEAIKKFKLVYALMPSDAEVEREIERLERELNPERFAPPVGATPVEASAAAASVEEVGSDESSPFGVGAEQLGDAPVASNQVADPSRFDLTDSHPFSFDDEPLGSTSEGALSSLLEAPSPTFESAGVPEVPAAVAAATPLGGAPELFDGVSEPEAEPFGDIGGSPAPLSPPAGLEPEADEPVLDEEPSDSSAAMPATLTMAQLFERQGHDAQAAELYRQILEHEPDNEVARNALARSAQASDGAVSGASRSRTSEAVKRLELWRAKVART